MRSLFLLFLLFLAACQGSELVSQTDPQKTDSFGIIGGNDVSSSDTLAKSIVALYNEQSETLCTGTFIARGFILTAAHCVPENPKALRVIFDQVLSANSVSYYATNIHIHPFYNKHRSEDLYDIAVVDISMMPENYQAMALVRHSQDIQKDLPVIAAGYGLNWAWGVKKGSGVLREVKLRIRNPYFGKVEMLIDQSLKKGICRGDSGGPLIIEKNGQLALAGIASRSDSIPFPLTPDCFMVATATRVDVFVPWIQSILGTL